MESKPPESEQVRFQLELAMEVGDVVWWGMDVESGAVEFHENKAYLLGYEPDDFTHYEDFTKLLHPADKERAMEAMRAHLWGEADRYDVEYRIRANDGSYHWFHDVGGVSQRTDDGKPRYIAGIAVDITNRREWESALQLRDWALDEAPVGISIVDMEVENEPLIYVNRTFEELTGYTADEALGRNCRFLQGPETDREATNRIREALDAGEPTVVELLNERKDGTKFWNRLSLTPLRDNEGTVTAYVGIQQDITERKEHEKKLEQVQERMQSLMHTQTVEETVGIATDTAGEVLDAPLSGFWSLNDAGDVLEPTAGVSGIEDFFDELPSYRRDSPSKSRAAIVWEVFDSGEPLFIDDTETFEPLTEPSPARCVQLYPVERHGMFIVSSPEPNVCGDSDRALLDILVTVLNTALDRVERERRLREREERLARQNEHMAGLLEATKELLEADSRETVTSLAVNKLVEVLELPNAGLWLYDEEREVLVPTAQTEGVADLVDEQPTYSGDEQSLSWQAFESGSTLVADDLSTIENRYNPETSLRSELIIPLGRHGVLNVATTEPNAFDEGDVTLAKLWARTVTQVLIRLENEQRLAERNEELTRERDRLDEFTAVVSHDLRNPLNVIQGSLSLAEETGETAHFERATRAVNRMNELIEDLLTLARTDADTDSMTTVPLRSLFENCWETVETADATLSVDEGVEDLAVIGDKPRLRQLVENLVGNAVEHGGSDVTVTVGTHDQGFFVEDDGPGIPPEKREEVLERGVSTVPRGTGFGLAIVTEVAEAHGWDIVVTESRTGGARFEFHGVEFVPSG